MWIVIYSLFDNHHPEGVEVATYVTCIQGGAVAKYVTWIHHQGAEVVEYVTCSLVGLVFEGRLQLCVRVCAR